MSSRIAICLFNELIIDFNEAGLVVGKDLGRAGLEERYEEKGIFYYRQSAPTRPSWVDIANTFTDLTHVDLDTSSSGGILLLKIDGRVLACCFGSSVSNINRELIIDDFGLGVAYRRILPQNTKSIESFTLSSNPITNNRSAAIPTTKDNFNVDRYLENITELSGFIFRESRHILIKGKEFFSTPSPENLEAIIELCTLLLADYIQVSNDEDFLRLTSTKKIKARAMIETLDNELIRKLRARGNDVFMVDFELRQDIAGYKLNPKGNLITSIEMADIYDLMPRRGVTVPYLKSKEIYPYDQDNAALPVWKLYKCLFCETYLGGNTYILYKGNWYAIESEYLKGLREFIRDCEIDNLDEVLGMSWDGNMDEGEFNIKLAEQAGGQCWDKMGYRNASYPHPIEFCDVLTNDFIIHVKKLKSSALNSHVLMQTAVSAQLLSADPGLLVWIKEQSRIKFRKNLILKRNNELKNENIGYLICLMSDSDQSLADSLPFFSLVSFNFVIKQIRQTYDVRVGKI